jgi:hypothetical protein
MPVTDYLLDLKPAESTIIKPTLGMISPDEALDLHAGLPIETSE